MAAAIRRGLRAEGTVVDIAPTGEEGVAMARATAYGAVFERFTRGDAARIRGGSGLGMAIVRAVAEAHGGRVAIVPGRETTVRVWLPDADTR